MSLRKAFFAFFASFLDDSILINKYSVRIINNTVVCDKLVITQ